MEQTGREHGLALTSIPMEYTAQPAAPLPSIAAGLSPADVMPAGATSTAAAGQLPDEATVITALLYLALGGVDQAHNLVTPLSWGAPTNYGGRPKTGSPAAQDAAYVHALVHRLEGACDGEFGSGFSNAQYWYRAAGQHPIAPAVLAAAKRAAGGNARLEALVAKHGSDWSPGRFVGVCEEASGRRGDAELRGFCEEVIRAEWHLLLEHCYQKL